ncbi:MAG: cytidine deaminase [Planctomycetes bacterium]|nr:cytidine deaminase [Planctomycetota bacterium]
MTAEELVAAAIAARERAYCVYSDYAVGAALLTESGELVTGCNVENASYGLTICAERVAASTAVAQGHRRFQALAVVTRDAASMCGACRQFLREFGLDLTVYLGDPSGAFRRVELAELLPDSFGGHSVDRG